MGDKTVAESLIPRFQIERLLNQGQCSSIPLVAEDEIQNTTIRAQIIMDGTWTNVLQIKMTAALPCWATSMESRAF
jgi:hypothetical protein